MALLTSLAPRREYRLAVAVMNEEVYFKEIFQLDVELHYMVRRSKRDFSVFSRIKKLCKQFRPDVIHVWDTLSSIYTVPAARLLGIPFINGSIRHAAVPRPFKKQWLVSNLVFPLSHRVVSNSLAGIYAHGKKPSTKYRVVYNGFDTRRVKELVPPEEIRKRFDISTPKVVGMVANFEDRKDYFAFVKVAKQVLERDPAVTFIAVGDGKNFEAVQALVQSEGLSRVKLLGRQEDVESIANLFDIALLLCNTDGHAEGFPNSIMEYMALGKPVIATDSGGSKELVLNDKTGYILRPFEIDGVVEKIRGLLDNPGHARGMGEKGHDRIFNELGVEQMVNNYTDIYKEFVEDSR